MVAVAATACARTAPARQGLAPPPPSDPEFLTPPVLVSAHRDATGATRLVGRSQADARVELRSPDGVNRVTAADDRGDWAVSIPATERPRLFALSATVGARVLRANGAVVTAPAPAEPAYLARSGAASMPTWGAGPVRIVAFDWDAGGGAGVAGRSAASTRVELLIDGARSGGGRSDAQGRFSLLAVRAPLRPGPHVVLVRTTTGTARLATVITPAPPLGDAAVRARREPDGWRIDWAPPGGGVQTSLAVTPASADR